MAAAMEEPKLVLPSGEFGMAAWLRLAEEGIHMSAGTEAVVEFGCPTPGAAPERWSGEWSAHRLADPTRCSRDSTWLGKKTFDCLVCRV